MTNGKSLCLNMIVKNEMANLERCLSSVAPYISCWVIGDTGSSDGTQDFIKAFFAARNVPGELHSFPFVNFEQARNAALDCAYASSLAYDYLLFDDADMELIVEEPGFRERLHAPGYRVAQRTNSSLFYWNTRLARRDVGARYHGVTHEYLDVPGDVEELHGVWYRDYASGSNRVDKFERDIRLLSQAIALDPHNTRYWFYLAQSYRDAGQTAKAAETYAKRANMGGWQEEAWCARLEQARCLRKLDDEGGFLREAVAAYNQRPERAEPLYDLARYYRDRGMNAACVLFCEPGLSLPRPDHDVLFLEEFVYTTGLREEFSIAANYAADLERKDRGFAACNWLALSREVPSPQREIAWSNLFFYYGAATAMMPSFTARPVGFTAPNGYRPSNLSVARWSDEIVVVHRSLNVSVAADDGLVHPAADGSPVHARNFLLQLADDLTLRSAVEILPPADLPEPAGRMVLGFEDMRLFAWRGELWCSASVRPSTPEAWCEQRLARIDRGAAGSHRLADWRVLRPDGPRVHEKNWMPRVAGDMLQFICLCDPTRVVDEHGNTVAETVPAIAATHFRGGTQAIAFGGGWLALIHEVQERDKRWFYQHRFIWLDTAGMLRGVSRPFCFNSTKGLEFAAGLAWHPDGRRLIVSYSGAGEAWIATVDADEVRQVVEDIGRLPWGVPGTGPTPLLATADGKANMEPTRPADSAGGALITTENRVDDIAVPSAAPCPLTQEIPATGVPADILEESKAADTAPLSPGTATEQKFHDLAPFLRAVNSPEQRRAASRDLDARIAPLLHDGAALPQINCFYEVLSDGAPLHGVLAATASMRAAGHPVRVWSYTPEKLAFLRPHGVELCQASDVVPRGLFNRVVAGSAIRYFSDLFRYALLYEHGGLWMDADVVLLRPFPFRGDYFFNLQWRGGHKGHFICGNVIYAEPHSPHLRNLYEMAVERFFGAGDKEFGDIGPKLLSDYVASDAGAALMDRVFSPMFFNTIDWMETDRFERPIEQLQDYLNDDRVFGVHLWNARTEELARGANTSFISLLSDPVAGFPKLTDLADRFDTDKNRHTGNRHCYARVYDRLLAPRRFSLRRLMEIGLCRGLAERNQTTTPSVELWQTYFPFCHVTGVDLTDFSSLNNDRFSSFVCDQSKPDQLRAVAARMEPGSFDVIIDDGSHASHDQQAALCAFFPLLAEGGWYIIEDLDWQPPGEDAAKITLTKQLLREIQRHGAARSTDPLGVGTLAGEFAEILFFDSHYELERATLLGGFGAIRRRGGSLGR